MIRLQISRRRWTPDDIEAGDANDPGESWVEVFEDADEADAYLWRHFGACMGDVYAMRDAGSDMRPAGMRSDFGAHLYYLDEGDTLETIKNGGCIEWTATLA